MALDADKSYICHRCGLHVSRHIVYHSPVDTPNLFEAEFDVETTGLYCPPEAGRPEGHSFVPTDTGHCGACGEFWEHGKHKAEHKKVIRP